MLNLNFQRFKIGPKHPQILTEVISQESPESGPLTCQNVRQQVVCWAIVGMHPPINPIRSRWIRPAPGPLWTHLLEVPLLDQKELDLGHDKTDLKLSGSAIILFYLAVCQPDHIYTRYVPCISFERSCIFKI